MQTAQLYAGKPTASCFAFTGMCSFLGVYMWREGEGGGGGGELGFESSLLFCCQLYICVKVAVWSKKSKKTDLVGSG